MEENDTRLPSSSNLGSGRGGQTMMIATLILFTTAILGPLLIGVRTGSFHFFLFRLYLPFYAVVLGWFVWKKRNEIWPLPTAVLLFATFSAWALLSMLWTSVVNVPWVFIVVSGLFVGAAAFFTGSDERTLMCYLLAIFVLVAVGEVIALWEIFFGGHLQTSNLAGAPQLDVRVGVAMASAWFYNRNDFSFFLVLALGPLFAAVLKASAKWILRAIGFICIGIFILIVWVNVARSAQLAAVVSVGSVFTLMAIRPWLRSRWSTPPKHGATILSILIFSAATAFVVLIWLVPNPVETVGSSLWIRWQLSAATLGLLAQTNGLGVGFGAFQAAIEASTVDTGGVLAPHNWLLYLLGTFGVVGTALFLAAYARLLWDLLLNAIESKGWVYVGLFGSLLALPIGALGPSNALHLGSFWLFIGLGAAAAYRTQFVANHFFFPL